MPIVASNADPDQFLRELAQKKVDKQKEELAAKGKGIVPVAPVPQNLMYYLLPLNLDTKTIDSGINALKTYGTDKSTVNRATAVQLLLYMGSAVTYPGSLPSESKSSSIFNKIVKDEILRATSGLSSAIVTALKKMLNDMEAAASKNNNEEYTNDRIIKEMAVCFDYKTSAVKDQMTQYLISYYTLVRGEPFTHIVRSQAYKTIEDAIEIIGSALDNKVINILCISKDKDLNDIYRNYLGLSRKDCSLCIEFVINKLALVPVTTTASYINRYLQYITQPPVSVVMCCYKSSRNEDGGLSDMDSISTFARPALATLPKYLLYIRNMLYGRCHSHVSGYDPCFGSGSGPAMVRKYFLQLDIVGLTTHLDSWFSLYGYRSPYIKPETIISAAKHSTHRGQRGADLLRTAVAVDGRKNLLNAFNTLAKQKPSADTTKKKRAS